MARYTIARHARQDMKHIWGYIAADSPVAADRMIDKFLERFRLLAGNPRMGQARPDIAPGVRCTSVGDYLLLYRITTRGVRVLRVLHGAMNYHRLF